MIRINIPNNNINERKYIIDILLGEFLGLEYIIEEERRKEKGENWEIVLENRNKLIIEDHFFNKFPKDLEYLKEENIPQKVEFVKNEFVEEDIPIIYGNNKIEKRENEIICCIDIFASSFFMLTRWEEYVNQTRDEHERFPAYASLAYKNNFLDRPVVNEYVEMLKNMLLRLGLEQKLKTRNFQLYLTHDIDHLSKWDTPKKFLRHLAGDIISRKSPKEFGLSLYNYVQMKLGNKNDPYDTFDYLMDISESIDTKSHFFFMAEGKTKYDNNYKSNSPEVLALVKKIKQRGHYIGIHPTYGAYNDKKQFAKEKQELESHFDIKITFGREHYLRFEVPTTWQIWEDNGMEWDSTVNYADKEGFRCGVCYEYSVYNILTRKKLKLKEKPLIVMEGSIAFQKDMTPLIMEKTIVALMKKVEKYNGEFVFLWHNSSFNTYSWQKYASIYQQIIYMNKDKNYE